MAGAPRTQKEECLEEGVGEQMEDCHCYTQCHGVMLIKMTAGITYPHRSHTQHHIAELADGGICQHAFNISRY